MKKVIVIGGGAAGMMAAISASEAGYQVCLLEKNEKLGKKVFITGKGRCNVTNAGDMETLFANVVNNSKFLYSAFYTFNNQAVMEFLEKSGCPLKIERGERVFPVSNHSSDIIAVLTKELQKRGVEIKLNTKVVKILTEEKENKGQAEEERSREEKVEEDRSKEEKAEERNKEGKIEKEIEEERSKKAKAEEKRNNKKKAGKEENKKKQTERVLGVELENGSIIKAETVIIATGGISYASTGSTGDGYRFAQETKHQLVECRPSLVPFVVKQSWCQEVMGLSLKNVSIRLVTKETLEEKGELNKKKDKKAEIEENKEVDRKSEAEKNRKIKAEEERNKEENERTEKGKEKEIEIYKGFGEMLFTHFGVSGPLILSASSYYMQKARGETILYIDLKPALTIEQLDKRLLREFEENKNKQFKNALNRLFPVKLIPIIIELSGIDANKKVNEISSKERQNFGILIKNLPLTVIGTRDYQEAIITKGGVSVKDVNPSTMESKLVSGMYFAGEVLDLDALTGGFNLQIAWSTGWLAGLGRK